MEINEVKIGDKVSFNHKGKKVTGKVLYRHNSKDQSALLGHVNVQADNDKSYPVTIHISKLKPVPSLKEENFMENLNEAVSELIQNIEDGNHIEAENIFNLLLQNKIDEILNVAKIEVAQEMFNTEQCEECIEEAKKKEKEESDDEDEDEDEDEEDLDEALKGNQHKIDANKNGKIDAHDFKMLRAKKGMKEEVENLDELSKKTLGSYVKKAMLSKHDADYDAGKASATSGDASGKKFKDARNTSFKRGKGIFAAVNKMAKEEVEQIDELSKDTLKSYIKKAGPSKTKLSRKADRQYSTAFSAHVKGNDKVADRNLAAANKNSDKAEKRARGIETAKQKMKEEAEQIDELSKKTLGAYVKKAASDVMAKGVAIGQSQGSDKNAARKAGKRFTGINAATNKLTKEETETTQEAYSDPYAAKKAAEMKKSHAAAMADAKKEFDAAKKKKFDKNFMKMKKEEVELEEGEVKALNKEKKKNFEKHLGRHGSGFSTVRFHVQDARKELKTAPSASVSDKVKQLTGLKRSVKAGGIKEDVEQVDEVITKKTPTGEVIKDFVHSKNPKFKGKSKKERIRMALGAKYAMMKKEEVEQVDELVLVKNPHAPTPDLEKLRAKKGVKKMARKIKKPVNTVLIKNPPLN